MHDFEDIRPYRDDEVRGVVDGLLQDLELSRALARFRYPRCYRWFPGLLARLVQYGLRHELRRVYSIRDVQIIIEKYLDKLIETTTDGLTQSGLERLDAGSSYLFISNHRDITMDPALVNYMLYHHGFDTVQIAIGDNLLKRPFLTSLMKLNKSFIVKRSLHGRDKLAASKQLSAYIRHCINTGQNVWIAQREGRAKDGMDKTETAIIKMLHMAFRDRDEEKLPLHEAMNRLRIVPVSISYEFDPCDGAKAAELHAIDTTGSYVKNDNTDVQSILTGMIGIKGAVHVSFGDCMVMPDDSSADDVTDCIDRSILHHYRLHLVNYLALEQMQPDFMDFATLPQLFKVAPEVVAAKRRDFQQRLQALPPALHVYVLGMYANPLIRKANLGLLDPTR